MSEHRFGLGDLHQMAHLVDVEILDVQREGYENLADDWIRLRERLNVKLAELEAEDGGSWLTEV